MSDKSRGAPFLLLAPSMWLTDAFYRAYYEFQGGVLDINTKVMPSGPLAKFVSKPMLYPVAALRELAIISCSTKLARHYYQLKAARLNTKEAFMNQLRDKGLGADLLAVVTYERGDPTYETRDGLAFLTDGSPKLRLLFTTIYDVCFIEETKLLVTEDVPLNA